MNRSGSNIRGKLPTVYRHCGFDLALAVLIFLGTSCDREQGHHPPRLTQKREIARIGVSPETPVKSDSANTKRLIPPQPTDKDWFDDVTVASNVDFSFRNGREGEKFTLLESVGGGAGLFDFNCDDAVDLFVTGGGTIQGSPIVIAGLPNALYRNQSNLRFETVGLPARLADSDTYAIGCSVCDYNCDGHPDLFVTGYPRCNLYCNQGDGTFADVTTAAGLQFDGLQTASTWGDFDSDGLPDLLVVAYVTFDLREDRNCGDETRRIRDICGIWQYPPAPDRLFRNRGDGTYEEVTARAGLRADGKGLGVVSADVNEDGALDVYIANDFTPNFLYLGDGKGQFRECGLISGTASDENGIPQGSMGVDFGDYDGDGRGDLFVTNYQLEDNTLYRNLGDAQFAVTNGKVGLRDTCRPYVGFGTGWVDWDSDGWLDLFVLNGHVMYFTGDSPYEQPQFLFRNRDGERFENRSSQGGPYFAVPHVARGGAVGDLDNDGAPDLVVVHQNSPVTVLKNRLPAGRWIRICLHGTASDPFAVGSVISSSFAGRKIVRHVHGGGGYLSHFDRRILLPVDEGQPGKCTIRWLNGTQEVFDDLEPGRTHHLIEGRGTIRETGTFRGLR